MSPEVERLFQAIGNHVLDMVGDNSPKTLAYAEVIDGGVSVGVFFVPEFGGIPIFKFGGRLLSDLFYSLWSEWTKGSENGAWLAASYVIQRGKPELELFYSDRFDQVASKSARRNAMVEKYFGSTKVDYSQT